MFLCDFPEIVFPGRPGSAGYSTVKSSGNVRDLLANSSCHQSLPNELTESGLQYQNDNKLHPFGLFWSELESSHAGHTEPSGVPSTVGRADPFGAMTDPASVAEKWSDMHRQDTFSGPNSFHDSISARHLLHVEQEPNHFDLAEQLMPRQFQQQQQQQLQQRNMLSPHSRLNESLLEHVPNQNLIHNQQLANHPVPDLEHLVALQLQRRQQQQLHIQQQHQLQQQQQFHQQLLQERQQSQARQVLLEQLLHGQIPDPGLPQSCGDPIRPNNVLDRVLLEQRLLHELQQQSHHPPRHFIPSVEQLAQTKFGQVPQQEPQRDLFELLSNAQHGQMPPLEHQILHQEQLQARQLSMGLRQRTNVEEERHVDSVWPVSENDQFLRSLAGNHRRGPLDFYLRQQRPLHEDQLSQLERNFSFQDRLRQGLYEPGSVPFERSLSLAAGASGMNMDAVNAMAHAHGLDMQELNARMHSAGQVGTFSSGVHSHNPHHPVVPNHFHVSHLDAIEGRWSESNGKLANDWMESQIQQLNINAERQKRESEVKMTVEDPRLWMSDGVNDDKSRRLLMELLHQKSGYQPADSPHINDGISFEKRAPSVLYSGSSSSDNRFSVALDREANIKNSFAVGSYGSSTCEPSEVASADDHANYLQSTGKLPFRSESGATYEGHLFLSDVNETAQAVFTDSNVIDRLSINKEYLEVEGRKHGSKSQGMSKGSVSEIQDGIAEQTRLATADRLEIPALSRHSSLGVPSKFLLIISCLGKLLFLLT